VILEQLKNEDWKSQQTPEFINAIEKVATTMNELTAYLYILVNYFEQYVHAVKTSPIFGPAQEVSESDDVSTAPTQTANRATRRARAKDHA
jgi:hypothetical protein